MIVWGDLIDITGCVNRDNKWPGDCFPPGFVFKDQEIFQYFALLWIDKREKWEPGLETAQFSFCVTTDEKYSIFASNPLIKKKKADNRMYLSFGNFFIVSWETTW